MQQTALKIMTMEILLLLFYFMPCVNVIVNFPLRMVLLNSKLRNSKPYYETSKVTMRRKLSLSFYKLLEEMNSNLSGFVI